MTDRHMTHRTEYVFAMTHPLMPGLIKIGMTTTPPRQYALELSATSVLPGKYELLCAAQTNDAPNIEADLHELFAAHCVRERDCFEVEAEAVQCAFRLVQCQALPCDDDLGAQLRRETHNFEPVESLNRGGLHPPMGGSVTLPDANAEYVRWRKDSEEEDD